jgi:signal transduction histidine kinase
MDAARAIARELGGEINVSSTVGEGSRFSMWIPRRVALGGPGAR